MTHIMRVKDTPTYHKSYGELLKFFLWSEIFKKNFPGTVAQTFSIVLLGYSRSKKLHILIGIICLLHQLHYGGHFY
jgi:hypothetical protein